METRVARCMMIAKVLAADQVTTDDERSFLESAMKSQNLTPDECEKVRNFERWEDAEPIVQGFSTEDKRALMDSLAHAVLADGRVSPEEMQTIERLSKALGLD